MKPRDDDRDAAPMGGYRDPLAAATARIEQLERANEDLVAENRSLLARMAVPGPLAQVDERHLSPHEHRRVIQRRVRALRRELHAMLGVRRYASGAIVGVTATAAFIVVAAEDLASWPLAVAILGMGAVARSLIAHWPGFEEMEDRRRKLAALKSELAVLRAQQAQRTVALPAPREGESVPG